jgi:hypothetical protein
MRYALLLVIGALSLTTCAAQDSTVQLKKTSFYAATVLGYANKGPVLGGSLNVLFPSQFGIYFRGFTNQYKSKNLPDDYHPGTSFFGDPPTPHDVVNVYSIGAIKEMTLRQRSYIYKAGLELGPCLLYNGFIAFTPSNARSGLFGYPSNYNQSVRRTNVFGLLVRPKVKMLDRQNWGVELASSIVIGSDPFYGIELNVTSGSFKAMKKKRLSK